MDEDASLTRSRYDLLENAAELITKSFVLRGFDVIITPAQIRALPLLLEEIIALRLYTGCATTVHSPLDRSPFPVNL